jgi:CheY-like chemotaxis protein
MLLCTDRRECDNAAVESINEALNAGYLCVYASVLNGDSAHLSEIAASISNFDDRVASRDLVIIDFKPFADHALNSNLAPFNELKGRIESLVEERVRQGKSDKTLIFAEAAGELAGNSHFDKSISLEEWWNDVHADWLARKMNITIICPHPALVFNASAALEARNNVAHAHTLTLELAMLRSKRQSPRETNILIVEPETDIRTLYQKYFKKLGGVSVSVEATGEDALEQVMSQTEDGFDLIILDAHLKDVAAIEVARRIISAIPDQRIAFTTTSSIAQLKSDIRSIRLNSEEVLLKPFSFSSLLGLIRVNERHVSTG